MIVLHLQLRSLALPFTVLEWTLPAAPRPGQNASSKQSSTSKERSAGVIFIHQQNYIDWIDCLLNQFIIKEILQLLSGSLLTKHSPTILLDDMIYFCLQRLLVQKILMKHVKVLLLHQSMVLLVCLKCTGGEYEILGTPVSVLVAFSN